MTGILAMTFARMNPPTVGHELLINIMRNMTWAHDKFLYLSGSEDDRRNPLSFDYKLKLCQQAFDLVDMNVMSAPKKDFFDAIIIASKHGYSELDIVVGSDRAEELRTRVPMYNGKLYHFRRIDIHEIPRTGDGIVHTISSTQMREAAIKNDYDFFVSGLPTRLRKNADKIFEEVRSKCLENLEST